MIVMFPPESSESYAPDLQMKMKLKSPGSLNSPSPARAATASAGPPRRADLAAAAASPVPVLLLAGRGRRGALAFVAAVVEPENAATVVEQDKAVCPALLLLFLDFSKKASFGLSRRRWRMRSRREGEAARAKGRSGDVDAGKPRG